MVAIWAKGCAALALVALSAPAVAAGPAKPVRSTAGKQVPPANPIANSRFDLTAGTVVAPPLVRPKLPPHVQPARGSQFGNYGNEYIEGPSWSYQTSRRGPVFEMGALGGGAMEDAPFLAHVAMAWQF